MEMRLGKTLCVIRGLGETPRILVVAPMVGLWAWKRELQLERIRSVCTIAGNRKQRVEALRQSCQWNLINYEGVRSTPEVLEEIWDAIVLDECRRISNPKAQITKTLVNWSMKQRRIKRIILSGNPAPESPLEYFEQMRFLYGSFLGCDNYWKFRNYFFRELGPHEWIPKPSAVGRIKEAVHEDAFVLTRKEAGIGDFKVYERRVIELSPTARKAYEGVKKEFLFILQGKELASTKWVPVQYMWLQQIASGFFQQRVVDHGKLKELVQLLQGDLRTEQVVVWFRFNSGLFEAARLLRKAGISSREIMGTVPPVVREQHINDFRSGKVRTLLCQIKTTKEAIDLSHCSTAIYFSNSHSLDERVQSEDRILHTAKKDPLLYIDLVARDTVDEDIVDLLQEKKVASRFFMSKLLMKLKAGGPYASERAVL